MNEHEMGFRSALVGGFQRDDVLTYIELTNRASAEEKAALTKSLDEVRAALSEMTARNDETNARNAELNSRNTALESEAEEAARQQTALAEELAALRGELEAERQTNAALREDNAALEASHREMEKELTALRSESAEYQSSKKRIAEIELRAYREAKELAAQGQADADRVRRQADDSVEQLKQRMQHTTAAYRSALQRAQSEFEEMQKRSKEILTGLDEAVKLLGKTPKSENERSPLSGMLQNLRSKAEEK